MIYKYKMKLNVLIAFAVWSFLFWVLFTAQKALPQEFLYPVKTQVNEKLMSFFTVGLKNEAKLQLYFIEIRKQEIQLLREQYAHSPKALQSFDRRLRENTQTLENILDELGEQKYLEDYTDIKESYEWILQGIENFYTYSR